MTDSRSLRGNASCSKESNVSRNAQTDEPICLKIEENRRVMLQRKCWAFVTCQKIMSANDGLRTECLNARDVWPE